MRSTGPFIKLLAVLENTMTLDDLTVSFSHLNREEILSD